MTASAAGDAELDEGLGEFRAGAERGELRVQACADCDRPRHPPQPRCPACHSPAVRWLTSSGRGTLWSFVVAHPPLPPEWSGLAPVTIGLVELAAPAGIRVLGTLVDPADHAAPAIGAPVEVVFRAVAGGPTLPHWRVMNAPETVMDAPGTQPWQPDDR